MTQLAAPFDSDPEINAAHEAARVAFESFAGNDITDAQPADPIDAVQVSLCRWQRNRFGLQAETHDLRMACGVVEEMGETFLADESAEDALDGLGDSIVFAAQLATSNRLAIGPIITLARALAGRTSTPPIVAAAMLTQVVLKGSQKIRGLDDANLFRTRLVGALAQCIAITLTDVEILHSLRVDPAGVFLIVAGEVMQRGAGHDGIPGGVTPEISVVTAVVTHEEIAEQAAARKARAMARMASAVNELDDSGDLYRSAGPDEQFDQSDEAKARWSEMSQRRDKPSE